MVTTILLARHGETDWNIERRIQGHTDRPLNDTGLAQARALGEALTEERIDAIYASDLSRALDTARIVAAPHGLAVTALSELRERNFGTWEGMTDEEALRRFPESRNGGWGDGETSEALAERIHAALEFIARAHPGGNVLVVTHGGPVRAVLAWCGKEHEGAIPNCHVHRIAVEDGIPRGID